MIPTMYFWSKQKAKRKNLTRSPLLLGLVPKNNVATHRRGFTLVEMLVALSIFMLVVVSGLGAIYSVTQASQRSKAQRIALDNLSFAIDAMTQRIRLGSRYHCGAPGLISAPTDCSNGGTFFAFEDFGGDTSSNSDQIVYRRFLDSATGNYYLGVSTNSTATYVPLTSPEMSITRMRFYVLNTDPESLLQPYVTIFLTGEVRLGQQTETVDVQTTISQRLLNN